MSSHEHFDFRGSTFYGPVTGKAEHHPNQHVDAPAPTATSTLPIPPTAFTGRERQVTELLEALAPRRDSNLDAVLISVVGGLGGVGKTALALHAAHAARSHFPGGTLFVNMRGYDDAPVSPEEAVSSLLTALGMKVEAVPSAPEERYALYRSTLEDRGPVLIVLDNVADPAQVVPLLPGSTRHRVLVTSRNSLDSLTARLINLDALSQDEAITLVGRSLRARNPTDSRIADEPDATRQLVELCGCLPLALHIAAALLHRRGPRPVAALVRDLQAAADRVRELRAPGIDQYGNELALRPVFDVTYSRLDTDQARLFRLLAQAPTADFGPSTAAALSDLSWGDLQPQLDDLTAAFLINRSPEGDRWEMHDLVRAYAATVSAKDAAHIDEAAKGKNRVLRDFFLHAASADQHLQGQLIDGIPVLFPSRNAALIWLATEHAALVAAALWAEQAEHSRFATALGLCLDRYLQLQRHFADGARVSQATLTAARRTGDRFLEMSALAILGSSQHEQRHYREAAIAHTNALRIAYSIRDLGGQATSWTNLGRCMHEWGQYEIAAEMHQRAQSLFSQLGDQHREAMSWNNLGMPLAALRRFDESIRAHGNAQEIFARIGDRQREATAWLNLGSALRESDDLDAAVVAYTNAAELFTEQRDRHGEAWAWNHIGTLRTALHQFGTAEEALLRSESVQIELGEWHGVGDARWNIALLHEARGQVARAAWASAAEAYARAGADEMAAKAGRHANA